MSKHRNAFLVVMLGMVLAFVAACGSGQSSEDKNRSGQSQQDQAAIQEVKSAYANFANLKSLRAQMSAQTQRPDGTIGATDFIYEIVPPDRYQLFVVGSPTSTLVIGNETFTKAANGTWSKIPEYSGTDYTGFNKLFNPQTISAFADQLGKTATVTKGGMDSSEGKQCQMYTITDNTTKNPTEVCIADRLPIRTVYNTGNLKTTVLLRDYNTPIDLSRPPV
jgi:hypothetical protein